MTASRASVPKPKGRVTKRMFGGFTGGKLHTRVFREEGAGYEEHEHAMIFTKRHEARAEFQDVRPVTVTWSSPLTRTKTRKGRGS